MQEMEQAQARIIAAMTPLAAETVPLDGAHGRFAAERVTAKVALPPFDNSAMDGYALRAADVTSATADNPVTLKLTGSVVTGSAATATVQAGACVRVFTGSPLPASADAVVMQEDTRPEASVVHVLDPVKPWENVRFKGEDIKAGETVCEPGDLLAPGRLGLLAGTGTQTVHVVKRPVIGIIATGSELREAGQPLGPGQIYESNRVLIAALAAQAHAVTRVYPIVPDTLADTRAALAKAFAECDAVITSGGASVGDVDHVKEALQALGGSLEFWRVRMKPGKPFIFGRHGDKPLFGLPGNPVASLVTFTLLVRPAILALQGARDVLPAVSVGELAEPLHNSGDRRHFIRVQMDGAGRIHSSGTQASHLLGSLAAANGLVDVPPGTTLPAGQRVKVWPLG